MDFGPGRDRLPPVQLSSAAMIRHRDEKTTLAFTLINGQKLTGQVRWFDDTTIHVATNEGAEITMLKHAILYYHAT
jgi:sRNA-binding regulator protein Hfq